MSADGPEVEACLAAYRIDRREADTSLEIRIERGGWRLREVGRPEVVVSDTAQLLARLEEISSRYPLLEQDQDEWRAAGEPYPGPFVPYSWFDKISSLSAAVYCPGDAPVAEVFGALRLLSSEGVRAGRQTWWIEDPGRPPERVVSWLRPWLDEAGTSWSGPIERLHVEIAAADDADGTVADPDPAPQRVYSFGPREMASLGEWEHHLDSRLRERPYFAQVPILLRFPPDFTVREVADVLQVIDGRRNSEIGFDTAASVSLDLLLYPSEDPSVPWWWDEVYRGSHHPFSDWLDAREQILDED